MMVLPRPMSSARQPPKPKRARKWSQPRPSRWYGRERPHEIRRGLGRPDALEALELRAGPREGLVAGDRGLSGQQGIEQPDLRAGEAQIGPLGLAEPGERRHAAQPLLRQHAIGAIAEPHGVLAAAESGQQLGQRDDGPVEVHPPAQLEPVTPDADLEMEAARAAIALPLGLDVPALREQVATARERRPGATTRRVPIAEATYSGGWLHPQLGEALRMGALGGGVAENQAPPGRLEHAPPGPGSRERRCRRSRTRDDSPGARRRSASWPRARGAAGAGSPPSPRRPAPRAARAGAPREATGPRRATPHPGPPGERQIATGPPQGNPGK